LRDPCGLFCRFTTSVATTAGGAARSTLRWGRFEKYAASILYVSLLGGLVLALIGILLFLLVFRPA
jgi:hypothetical protein